ncbi:MAG: diguanylate cyclase domain-containing protein [Actinomycetota bacterium]
MLASLGGAWVVLRSARKGTADRAAWVLLGTAMLLWGTGEVLWGYYEVILGNEVPFPSPADIAYLGAVPFAVAGLLMFARGSGARFHLRTMLDGCLVSASLLFIAWALALGPAWRADDGDLWVHIITVSYPATDLLMAVLALVVVQWGNSGERSALRTLAGALVVMAVADTAFTWLTTNGTFTSSNPISMLWPASYVMVALAAHLRHGRGRDAKPREESLGAVLTPYVPLLGALAIAAPRVLAGHELGPFLTVNGAVLVALVLARQGLTAWELRTTVEALHDRERELERLAHEDSLTGLANRASFATRLESAVTAPEVDPAVIYIDLDGFKQVNDRLGHAAGDELLVEVSRRLEACLEPSMMLARLGGDEFVVLVTAGHPAAVAAARRIMESFTVPFHHDGEAIPFGASLGIGTAPAGSTPDEAVRRADAAMYVAKATGRARAVDYPDEALIYEAV